MDTKTLTGKITFIHHDKAYVSIEYLKDNKKKSINGSIDEKSQERSKSKNHQFHIGDEVSFIISPTPKGDKMMADNIQFLYNNALDNMLNKAATENRFVGYLKKVDDNYFVKETGSYVLFPLILSPWEKEPNDDQLNEPVFFKLENIDKKDKATASLFKNEYIPEYYTAMKLYKNKTIITSEVYKITPYGIFVHIVGDKISGKIALDKNNHVVNPDIVIGTKINVIITYFSSSRIVIERAS